LIDKILEYDLKNANCIYDDDTISYNKLEYNTKKAGTYIEAINSIRANIIVFADADDSFEVDDISLMINMLKLGYYDIIVGTKDLTSTNRSIKRKIISFFKRLITKPFLPKGITDSQTGLKAMNWSSAQYILPYLHENMELAIDLEILNIAKKLNFKVLQVPVKCTDREGSHVGVFKDSIKFMKNLTNLIRKYKNI
jgi:glycosyltransferase involved in cell wall biosynthesis